jgi:phosphonoacetate hydrolase
MLDGFGWDYWEQSEMPNLRRMAENGRVTKGSAVFPTLTNVNNVSIACGCWPEIHGVATNCYYDQASHVARLLEDASFLLCPTLFSCAAGQGIKSALLTCKGKTLGILGKDVELALAAENLSGNLLQRYSKPPAMYSAEINYWLWEAALDILNNRSDIGFLYVHTTDFPMHRWSPEEKESLAHLKRLDEYLGEVTRKAPDAALLLTADHGMNSKTVCLDLARVCAGRGQALKFAVSPLADRLLEHHGGHGGVSYLYLNHPDDTDDVLDILHSLDGVEEVLDRKAAAQHFHLPADRLGDLVVLAGPDCVFGSLEEEKNILPEGYRNHGSLHESDIPIISYNLDDTKASARQLKYNFELTRGLF